jgi:23S rRNA (cytidine1920-2'-O)/16S rRNA (cytidine1409-2'-O)-methyltransferase
MARVRADVLIVRRGLSPSRAKAQAAIAAGGVSAAGAPVRDAAQLVDEDAPLDVAAAHPWVSRGGVKLAFALDRFGVDPAGRTCLDIGASTGGFTDVLLARAAACVVAVDVGHGQLHPRLAADPRVILREGQDIRAIETAIMPAPPDLIVCDVSFIGLAKAAAPALALSAPAADFIALVKPQFEAGPRAGKAGVLGDDVARRTAADAAAAIDGLHGFVVQARCESPIRGKDGNLEFLLHARRSR